MRGGSVFESECALTAEGVEAVVAGALPGDEEGRAQRREEAHALLAFESWLPGVGGVRWMRLDGVLRAVAEAAIPPPTSEAGRIAQHAAAAAQALRLRRLYDECDVSRDGAITLAAFERALSYRAPSVPKAVAFRAFREMGTHAGKDDAIPPAVFVRVCLAHAIRMPERVGEELEREQLAAGAQLRAPAIAQRAGGACAGQGSGCGSGRAGEGPFDAGPHARGAAGLCGSGSSWGGGVGACAGVAGGCLGSGGSAVSGSEGAFPGWLEEEGGGGRASLRVGELLQGLRAVGKGANDETLRISSNANAPTTPPTAAHSPRSWPAEAAPALAASGVDE